MTAPMTNRLNEILLNAMKKGGNCLSTEYLGSKGKLVFKCSEGHIFMSRPTDINQGKWCPECAVIARSGPKKHDITVMRKIAAEKGGICLSENYLGASIPLTWECGIGHQWQTAPKNILSGKWCHVCAGNSRISKADAEKIASSRGGRCLSDLVSNTRMKLEWQCAHGHKWSATYNSLASKKSWCPDCASGIHERVCRAFLEQLFDHPFPKARPEWLKSPEGNQMELDGYCQELAIAFEHQGEQHLSPVAFFADGEKGFQRQKDLDEWKQHLCRSKGVRLFVIPQIGKYLAQENFVEFVKVLAAKLDVATPPRFGEKEIDLSSAYATNGDVEAIKELTDIARSRGGECLSSNYAGRLGELLWICANGHKWSATAQSIRAGYWCRQCSDEIRKRNEPEMQEIATRNGGTFIGFSQRGKRRLPTFLCAEGHSFLATNPLRSWCPLCDRRGTKLTLEEIVEMAAKRGGKCLSQIYVNNRSPMQWECSDGHQWTAITALIRRGAWCPICSLKKRK